MNKPPTNPNIPQEKEKVQCPECKKWVKELDEENELCPVCVKYYDA